MENGGLDGMGVSGAGWLDIEREGVEQGGLVEWGLERV